MRVSIILVTLTLAFSRTLTLTFFDAAASARGLLVTDDCLAGARVKATLCPIDPVDKANVPLSTCYSVTFVQPPEDLKITRSRPLKI